MPMRAAEQARTPHASSAAATARGAAHQAVPTWEFESLKAGRGAADMPPAEPTESEGTPGRAEIPTTAEPPSG
jgi:hypothetical protein